MSYCLLQETQQPHPHSFDRHLAISSNFKPLDRFGIPIKQYWNIWTTLRNFLIIQIATRTHKNDFGSDRLDSTTPTKDRKKVLNNRTQKDEYRIL